MCELKPCQRLQDFWPLLPASRHSECVQFSNHIHNKFVTQVPEPVNESANMREKVQIQAASCSEKWINLKECLRSSATILETWHQGACEGQVKGPCPITSGLGPPFRTLTIMWCNGVTLAVHPITRVSQLFLLPPPVEAETIQHIVQAHLGSMACSNTLQHVDRTWTDPQPLPLVGKMFFNSSHS